MNIFSRLFGKKQQSENAIAIPSNTQFTEQLPPADDLIHAALHPATEPEPEWTTGRSFTYTRPTAIRTFLDKEYRTLGEQDALLNPTAEMRNQKLDSLGKHFRFMILHAQEQIEAQLAQLQQHITLMGELSPVLTRQQNLRLQQLTDMLKKLQTQAELSVDDEGWIASVLADYQDGFLTGAMRFQRENELLSGLNTLT